MTAATTPLEQQRLGYRPALDGLRGVAILLVLAQHTDLPGFHRAGSVGVTLFFVLSGFLITTLLLEERERSGRIAVGAFYLRRARRLLPALAVFLVVMAAAGVALPILVSAAFYYANWLHVIRDGLQPLGHMWSLSVEEQFYIGWPLLLTVVPRRWLLPMLIAGIVLATGLRVGIWWLAGDREWTFFATFTRIDALFAGAVLAAVRGWAVPQRWALIAAIALVMACMIPDLGMLAVVGLPIITAGSVVLVAVAASRSSRLLSAAPLVHLGTISYGLYLWHGPLTWVGRQQSSPLMMLALVALAVLLAILSRRYVEMPFLTRRSARGSVRSAFQAGAAKT